MNNPYDTYDPYKDAANPNTKKNLIGSRSRDLFKWLHKQIGGGYHASDTDLALIDFNTRDVIAYLDYKQIGDTVTETEKVLYDRWSRDTPVFIVEGVIVEGATLKVGPFTIKRYLFGGQLEFICNLKDLNAYQRWELAIRQDYSKNHRGGRRN